MVCPGVVGREERRIVVGLKPEMAESGKGGFRFLILAFSLAATVLLALQLTAEYHRMVVQRYTAKPPGEKVIDANRIRQAAGRAVSFYPFRGGMDDLFSAWLEYRRAHETGEGKADVEEELLSNKRSSLIPRRSSAIGWASLAENLAYYGQRGFEFHYALQAAARYGMYDYDVARMILGLSIREWPRLGCGEKRIAIRLVEYAENVDDNVIFYSNYDAGMGQIRDYLETVSKQYGFDPDWARLEAERCRAAR